jgi:hypothetical protein
MGGGQCVGGQCQRPATLVATPASLQFGNVTVGVGQSSQSVTISNSGGQNSGAVNFTENESGATFALSSTCPVALAPGASCQVTVLGFTATQAGAINASFSVTGGSNQLTIPLRATAAAAAPPAVAALVTSSPQGASFDYGEVVQRTDSTVTWVIANTGNAASGALAVTSSDPLNFAPSPTSCPAIPPLGSCNVSVTFTPQADLQPRARSEFRAILSVPGLSYTFEGTARPPNSAEDP